jgi:hypothetical protein
MSAHLRAIPAPVALEADEVTVDKHGRFSAKRAFGTVCLQLGIGNINIFGGIIIEKGMGHGVVSWNMMNFSGPLACGRDTESQLSSL